MEYMLIIQGLFIILLLFLYLRSEVKVNKLGLKLSSLKEKGSIETTESILTNDNKRKHYRLGVEDLICKVELVGYGKTELKRLKNKEFEGYIDNISTTGLKFTAATDLPVKERLTIEMTFEIKDIEFTIQGEIVRREELLENEFFGYGVEFNQLSRTTLTNLTNTLVQLEVESVKRDVRNNNKVVHLPFN